MLMATNSHLSANRTPGRKTQKPIKSTYRKSILWSVSFSECSAACRREEGKGEMAVWSTPTVSRVIITPTEAVTKAFSWVWEFHKEKTEINPRDTDSIRIPFTTQDVKFNFAPSWFLKSTLGLKYTRKHLVPVGNTQASLSE